MKVNKLNVLLASVLIVPIVANGVFKHLTVDYVDAVIAGKERVLIKGGEDSKYIVFTESETFENSDTMFFVKYNSSDIQGSLKNGDKVKLKVSGVRVQFLSWYRNIVEVSNEKN